MAINTPLDEIIDYKDTAIKKMLASQDIMSLIFDTPNIDMESDAVYNARKQHFFDYGINPNTIESDTVSIFVQSSMVNRINANFKGMAVTISIVCNVGYIIRDKKKFKGIKGNRIDNIARHIVVALDDDENSTIRLAKPRPFCITRSGNFKVPYP